MDSPIKNSVGSYVKNVNHIGIVSSDITISVKFYTDVLGFAEIRRPNFNRHGAWLSMGNVALHLMKGLPVVPLSDNLIIPHISLETEHPEEVGALLNEMNIPFDMIASKSDNSNGAFSGQSIQYFIRDPDGYVIEICNCGILNEFCFGQTEKTKAYKNLVEWGLDLSHIFKLAFVAEKCLRNADAYLQVNVPPRSEWALEVDQTKLNNLLTRCHIYVDVMQGETKESIDLALKQSNNNVPLATRLLRAAKMGKEIVRPPPFFLQDLSKYQPQWFHMPTRFNNNNNDPQSHVCKHVSSNNNNHTASGDANILKHTFEHFDKDSDGKISSSDVSNLLRSLNQNVQSGIVEKMFHDLNKTEELGIDFNDFKNMLKSTSFERFDAFFSLLDVNGTGEVTCPNMSQILLALGFDLRDFDIENIFNEIDQDGNGSLSKEEICNYFCTIQLL